MALLIIDGTPTDLYTISDLARAVRRAVPTVMNLVHRDGTVPTPTILVGKRNYYDRDTFWALVASMTTK